MSRLITRNYILFFVHDSTTQSDEESSARGASVRSARKLSSLTSFCRSRNMDTRRFLSWWLLISFKRAKVERPTHVANDDHPPN